MSRKTQEARRSRKAWRKFFRSCFLAALVFAAGLWLLFHYAYLQRWIDHLTLVPIDTREVDRPYELLSRYQKPAHGLVPDPGGKETDDLRDVLGRLKEQMGLGQVDVALAFHDAPVPPGFIRSRGDEKTIFLSRYLKSRREQVNVLVHELCHIYVWNLKRFEFQAFDQEKLVDISGVFLGFGILTLNGMTDDYHVTADGGYATEQKTFGYLKPEQFGYLLARFCGERGIAAETLKPYLNSAGWKFFQRGNACLKRKTQGENLPAWVVTAQSAIRNGWGLLSQKFAVVGIELPQFPEAVIVTS